MKHSLDNILDSLNNVTRAEAPPYFYSKLRNRMYAGLLPKPMVWRLALALVVVALLNIATLQLAPHSNAQTDANAQSIASEYSLTLPETY
ncbi:MAG: hypothetical protein EOO08_03515 [Chitinophagaceae bacterium]|nr:MAG: hypothetical protein EOO08_03515 [Chitinophagaceae bacterium]